VCFMKKIAVLLGGCGKEREISLKSGKATVEAINELGYKAIEIDGPSNLDDFSKNLEHLKPDVVFNCLHGQLGEDGIIQAILDKLKIPYTHSGAKASELAMDKWQTFEIFKTHNIPTPYTMKISVTENASCPMELPFVVKPISEGSSIGVSIVNTQEEWSKILKNWQFGNECIVQKYMKCREIHVAILNDIALGTIEICPNDTFEFFTYQAKYVAGESKFICPAPISEMETKLANETALRAYHAFNCRGLARVDMLFDGNTFFVLELNTQPGFTSTSLAPQIAKSQGISFNELVSKMIDCARCD
ncbi:MAG: D-alanine--D-alanine ligase, partial [Proteobacteria bacterium]|nr:D-alanine--D-alanine ligase [Pseudomonadota bacterium]